MRNLLKDALILCIITLTAGTLLAGVYEITKEPIHQQELLAQQKACQEVFANAERFENVDFDTNKMQETLETHTFTMEVLDQVFLAKDENDTTLGYVIQMIEKNGYGGDITIMIGIQNNRIVNGISILSIHETAGLGMNATKESFKSQFSNKQVTAFTHSKNPQTSEEIDVISGATITTKAMVNGVNASLCVFDTLTKEEES